MRYDQASGIAVALFAAAALFLAGTASAQDKTKKDTKKAEPAAKADAKAKAAPEEDEEEVVEEEDEESDESSTSSSASTDKAKADYEEETEAEEAEIEEESEEALEAEEGAVEEEEEGEEEEEAEEEEAPPPPKVKKERAPLPEIPPVGVPLTEGKWVNLYFSSSIVTYYRMALQGLSGPAGMDMTWNHSFVANWIYLGFYGNFWDGRIVFDVKGDLAEFVTAFPGTGSGDWNSFLLDASVGVRPLLGLVADDFSGLTIKFGRFVPDMGYYHTRNVGLLDVAEYPLATSAMMPFRQVGLEVLYDHKYFGAAIGVFNGMRFGTDLLGASTLWLGPGFDGANSTNVVDDNKAKDFMVRVTGKIPIGLSIEGFFWLSRPEFQLATGAHAVAPVFVYGGEAVYENLFDNYIRLKLVANFTGRTMTYPEDGATGDPVFDSFTQMGILFHAGLRIGQWVEPVVRIEMWNGRAVETAPGVFEGQDPFGLPVPGMASGDTWDLWATFGLNGFLFGDHLRLSVLGTYIRRSNDALGDDFWITGQAALVL